MRRALERELFEAQAFRRVISGAAPTLDVEVLSFEELRRGKRALGAPFASALSKPTSTGSDDSACSTLF